MAEEQHEMPDLRAPNNPHSHIKKVIGIISGKGGVGKSLTTSILAAKAAKEGKKVAISMPTSQALPSPPFSD